MLETLRVCVQTVGEKEIKKKLSMEVVNLNIQFEIVVIF